MLAGLSNFLLLQKVQIWTSFILRYLLFEPRSPVHKTFTINKTASSGTRFPHSLYLRLTLTYRIPEFLCIFWRLAKSNPTSFCPHFPYSIKTPSLLLHFPSHRSSSRPLFHSLPLSFLLAFSTLPPRVESPPPTEGWRVRGCACVLDSMAGDEDYRHHLHPPPVLLTLHARQCCSERCAPLFSSHDSHGKKGIVSHHKKFFFPWFDFLIFSAGLFCG